ncbi:MAG: PQQ-binding-like beta-propeller repeat protein [Methylophilus sp.]|nr:PQQ-binding-like beta-propeller repeat protein [Methylophilus sp.]
MHCSKIVNVLWFLVVLFMAATAHAEKDTPTIDPTTKSIHHPLSGEWPSYGRDYTNQRFSPLKQINRSNVQQLDLKWSFKSGVKGSFQATPIVVDGVMYLSLPYDHVVALDARSGKELWRYQHHLRPDRNICCGPANRGVAVGYGKVFIGTVDARLVALNRKTGAVDWDIDVIRNGIAKTEGMDALNVSKHLSKAAFAGSTGASIVMAPVLYENKVLVGITGVGYGLHLEEKDKHGELAVVGLAGNYGMPGFLAAYDVSKGKQLWKFDTIPTKEWEGNYRSTTADGVTLPRDIAKERSNADKYHDAWEFGGGSAWSTPAIDPKLGLLYFGTGNPSPQMEDTSRPGDNLYTVSLVALEINTGKLRWFYQQVPHDLWGYDVASPPVLFDLQRDGKTIAAVGQAGKTGWFYVHDRATGELLYKSDAFVPQENMFKRATTSGIQVSPSVVGGVNWSPSALDEKNGLAFVSAIHWPAVYTLHEEPTSDGKDILHYTTLELSQGKRWGVLAGIDLNTGKLQWAHQTEEPLIGGVLATAGGLVFTGEGNGNMLAVDMATGHTLWSYRCEAGANAPPITYEIDGIQYVAIAAGGNQLFGFQQGDQLAVFALKLR